MGYGADLQVRNDGGFTFSLGVYEIEGMYDHGDHGSDVSGLRGDLAYISPGQTAPKDGAQYIEASSDDASFKLTFGYIEAGSFGTIKIVMSDATYDYEVEDDTDSDVFDVAIDNDEQASIVVTVS